MSRRRVYHDPDPDKLVSPVTGEKIAEYGTWKQDAKRAQLTGIDDEAADEVGIHRWNSCCCCCSSSTAMRLLSIQ